MSNSRRRKVAEAITDKYNATTVVKDSRVNKKTIAALSADK